MVINDRNWLNLEQPRDGHPDEAILWKAEQALHSLGELSESPDIRNAFVQRLGVSREELIDAANLVSRTDHTISFVGNIGVGKTTAICRVAGLEIPGGLMGETVPVLEVGAGGTTICEVHLVNGANYGLIVEPTIDTELKREVCEFARIMMPSPDSRRDEETGISREVARAIRNMSGLSREQPRNPDGTLGSIVDHARNLADELADVDAFADEIWSRMDVQNRTRRELWYEKTLDVEPLQWIQDNFKLLNYGRHPEFSLPSRVQVVLPQRILGDESLSIRIVDTKGIDGTAERADLEAHLNDADTVTVLCSSFNDAPAPTLQQLLERAVRARYPDLESKCAVLVLPHSGQALGVKDDFGDLVVSSVEGYQRKQEEAVLQLQDRELPNVRIDFFNVHEDDVQQFNELLLDLVAGLRDMHCARLTEVVRNAIDLVQNYENEQVWEIQKQAARRVAVWLENNQQVDQSSEHVHHDLFRAIDGAYASTLRASVRREGNWHKLDYSYHLGYGARTVASSVVSPKLEEFKAITTNLLQDDELADAFDLVLQARRTLEDGVSALLNRSYQMGMTVHTGSLRSDAVFWSRCVGEWGQGTGYKRRVSGHHQDWFSVRTALSNQLQGFVENEWRQILGRVSAILPTEELHT